MEEILNKLNLDEDIKTALLESFNNAVLVEATKLAEEKSKEYEKLYESQIDENHQDLINTLDEYLDKAVEQYISENKIAIDNEVNETKLNALLEGFNALTIASGVELMQIKEANDNLNESNNENYKELSDNLMEENIKLKEQVGDLFKLGLINEAAEGMTLVEQETFSKIAENIYFDKDNLLDYKNKLFETAKIVKSKDINIKESFRKNELKKINRQYNNINNENLYTAPASHLF